MPPDWQYLAELADAAEAAVEAMGVEARRLADKPVTGTSRDGSIKVRVNGGGTVLAMRLEDDVLRRYDSTVLSEMVTRTIRDTQRKAREAFQQAVEALTPPEVTASQTAAEDTWRE